MMDLLMLMIVRLDRWAKEYLLRYNRRKAIRSIRRDLRRLREHSYLIDVRDKLTKDQDR